MNVHVYCLNLIDYNSSLNLFYSFGLVNHHRCRQITTLKSNQPNQRSSVNSYQTTRDSAKTVLGPSLLTTDSNPHLI